LRDHVAEVRYVHTRSMFDLCGRRPAGLAGVMMLLVKPIGRSPALFRCHFERGSASGFEVRFATRAG